MAPKTHHKTFADASQATFQEVLQERLRIAIRVTLLTLLEEEVAAFCNAAPLPTDP